MRRELEVYLHIPFCARKCAYCDFLSAPASGETMRRYAEALCGEIRAFGDAGRYEVSTVFFGGGTPSILPPEWMQEILTAVRERFRVARDAEITAECNPGTADLPKLRAWRAMGINRLSLGLQSADDAELRLLGRIHTWQDFLETYRGARQAGFENINIDLMAALPGQTVESWERTLYQVAALGPEHISAYSLILEEGTPFYERYREDARRRDAGEDGTELPSEEEERQMDRRTEQILGQAGLYRYEISNYARPGRECRHNCGYWTRKEYVGFGLGSASLLGECRYKNTEDLEEYLARDFSGRQRQPLSVQDQMEEFLFLGLRMEKGVSEEAFASAFGVGLSQVYGEVLVRMESLGLLCREGGRVFLSARGRDLANYVMSEFIL